MKITYTPNPLNTIIELDEFEQKELWYKIKLKEMEELAYGAYFTLTHHDWWNKAIANGKDKPVRTLEDTVAEAVKELEPEYWLDEEGDKKSKLDERVDMLLQHYLEELKSNHVGDCTCFAMSCSKCHAESMLGLDTIKGLGKHSAHKIQSAFSNGRDGDIWLPEASLDEAISRLENYNPTKGPAWKGFSQEDFDAHVPRWKAEAAAASTWLKNYRDQHFA